MKSSSIDTVLEVRLRHEPGTLARLATAIAGEGGLLCEIETLRVGDEHTLRELTVETRNTVDVARVIAAVEKVDGVTVMSTRDRVMDAVAARARAARSDRGGRRQARPQDGDGGDGSTMNDQGYNRRRRTRCITPTLDRQFDRLAPRELGHLSPTHWTPVRAAVRAAGLLCAGKNTRVLDVGAGIGKVCAIGALAREGTWVGVEQYAPPAVRLAS